MEHGHTGCRGPSLFPAGLGREWIPPTSGSAASPQRTTMLFPHEAHLSATAYDFLANLVYERSRIRLGPDRQTLVTGRLRQRVQSLGMADYEEYCALLRSPEGEDEVDSLIDLISTNHTHFFREASPFRPPHPATPAGAGRPGGGEHAGPAVLVCRLFLWGRDLFAGDCAGRILPAAAGGAVAHRRL